MGKYSFTTPTELKDIKLSQYQKFIKVTEGKEDVNFIGKQMVSIFCNISEDVIDRMKSNDYRDTLKTVKDALAQKPKFYTKTKLDGVSYGFIPKLDDITVKENVDIEITLKEVKDWNRAMAICYRPITSTLKGRYLVEDYDYEKHDDLDVNLDVCLGCMGFFLNLRADLLSYTLSYTVKEAEANPKLSQILGKNGDGIRTYTQSLKGISLTLRE